jgi:hypothetical protein
MGHNPDYNSEESNMDPQPSFRAPIAVERVFNRVFGSLVGLGLGFSHNYLLQVRGRKSGKIYSTPIDLLERGGKQFLVAPRGRTQWVRNAEAAGEVTPGREKGQSTLELSPIRRSRKSKGLSGRFGAKFNATSGAAGRGGLFVLVQITQRSN